MRTAVLIFLWSVSIAAAAAVPQTWEFVYVSRSTNLETVQGQGTLLRNGSRLSGLLTDTTTGEYEIKVKVTGTKATATFGSTESDDGGTRMWGTYRQSSLPVPGGSHCWQTIHLSDGFSSVVLARNAPVCEP